MASLNAIMARLANDTDPWQSLREELGMTQVNSNMWVLENDYFKLQLSRMTGGIYKMHYRSGKQKIMACPISIEQLKQIMQLVV